MYCFAGQNAENADVITPGKEEFIWEADGSELESLSGETCAQSTVFRIQSTYRAFRLKVCPSSTAGSLGNLHVYVVKGSSNSKLHWPFQNSLRLSVIVRKGNTKIHRCIKYDSVEWRKSKRWSLVTGSCPSRDAISDVSEPQLNPESWEWTDFITRADATNNYEDGKLRIKAIVYTKEESKYIQEISTSLVRYSWRNTLKPVNFNVRSLPLS